MRQPPEKDGAGPLLRLGVEAEAVQDGGGARRRGMRADVGEPRLDLGPAQAVGAARLRPAARVRSVSAASTTSIRRLRPGRRLLRHRADARMRAAG